MKISCSPSFVTAIYSLLAMLNLSKQELGGTGQLSALHLWLHIRWRLCFLGPCFLSPCACMEGPGHEKWDVSKGTVPKA